MSFDDQSHTHADKASLNGKSGEDHNRAIQELNTIVPKADARFQQSLEEELVARLRAKQGHSRNLPQALDERKKHTMQMTIPATSKRKLIDFQQALNHVPLTLVAVMIIVFFMGGALIVSILPEDNGGLMGSPNNGNDGNGAGIPLELDDESETSTDTEQTSPEMTVPPTLTMPPPMFPTATPFGLEAPNFWVIGTTVVIPDDVRQVPVYLYPTEQSQIVDNLNAGTEVTIVEQVGDWVNVVVTQSGAQLSRGGWIDGRLLIRPDGETPGLWATPTPIPLDIQAVQATSTPFMPTVPPSGEMNVVTSTPISNDNGEQGRAVPDNPTQIPTVPPPFDVQSQWNEREGAGWVIGVQEQMQFEPRLISVVIAAREIQEGDEITLDDVFITYWIEENVPDGIYVVSEDVVGRRAVTVIPRYTPILYGELEPAP